MENTPIVIRPPPPPPPSIFPPSPPSPLPDNATTTITGSPPPLPFSTQPPQMYPIVQNGAVPTMTINQPPPFPDSPTSIDLSPLEFILALMAFITIPAVIYAFFFAVKCPSRSSRGSPPDSPPRFSHGGGGGGADREMEDVVSGVKYQKETHSKDVGNECPVCLSVFADGEEVRQLSGCKHSFHANCIDQWLNNNHNNCPICRAPVAVKRPPSNNNRQPPRPARDHSDFHQGLPDAANLV